MSQAEADTTLLQEHRRKKRILLLASAPQPVCEFSTSDANRLLWTLERELQQRGWQTTMAACAGSQIAGELLPIVSAPPDEALRPDFLQRIATLCAEREFEAVLDYSECFFHYAASISQDVLAALFFPRELYPPDSFRDLAPNLYFHCVSQTQMQQFFDLPHLLGTVRSGIDVARFAPGRQHAEWLLWLGEITPERAPDRALAIARAAQLPIVLAGPSSSLHRQFWQQQIQPDLDGQHARWIENPDGQQKLQLLRDAKALLITADFCEPALLTALEALACGTPVIAMARSGLGEIVAPGTGFIVNNTTEAVAAILRLGEIRARDCRDWVAREFSAATMTDDCEALLANLHEQRRWQQRRADDDTPR